MDHAPLRPLPGRPHGPVPDAEAVRAVAVAVPGLDEREREALALALVALAGRPRYEVGARLGLDAEALAVVLTRARKALRRTLSPLPGSGWCERAERLISDRLDDALTDAAVPRLEVHLRNCPRCVEHERRLVQASDSLVAGLASEAPADPAPLEVIEPPGERLEPPSEPEGSEPAPPAEVVEPPPEPDRAQLAPPEVDPEPRLPDAEPEAASPGRSRRQLAAAVSWNLLLAVAFLLALGSLALAVAGALGAGL